MRNLVSIDSALGHPLTDERKSTVTKLGYVNPWIVGGAAITSIGSGLMTTFTANESASK